MKLPNINKMKKVQLIMAYNKMQKLANQRLRNLRKSGYYDYNPSIKQKYDTYLTERGTASKNFKSYSKHWSTSFLKNQVRHIRNFLQAQTSTRDTKNFYKKMQKRFNEYFKSNKNDKTEYVTIAETMEILKLYGESDIASILYSSDQIMYDIAEALRNGYTSNEIKSKLQEIKDKGEDISNNVKTSLLADLFKGQSTYNGMTITEYANTEEFKNLFNRKKLLKTDKLYSELENSFAFDNPDYNDE